MTKVTVIGGGLSGLSAAILLVSEGFEVSLYEREKAVGGNFTTYSLESYDFEVGPSFFALPEVLESVFKAAGKEMNDYLEIELLKKHTTIHFIDGVKFEMSNCPIEMKKQLEIIDPFAAKHYDSFLKEVERLYYEFSQIDSEFHISNWMKLVEKPIRNLLLKLRPFESIDQFLRKYFNNEQLIQLLAKYANQEPHSSKTIPAFLASQLFMMLSSNVYYTKGGNSEIPNSLRKLALELGVKFYTNKEITKIHVENQKVIGIQVNHDLSIESDCILMSSSQILSENKLLDEQILSYERKETVKPEETKYSQFILFLGLKGHTDLGMHSVLFSSDVELEVEQLNNGEFATNPTIYLYNPAQVEPERFPNGDSLVITVLAPFVDEENVSHRADIITYRSLLLNKIKEYGYDLEPLIVEEKLWTAEEIKNNVRRSPGKIFGFVSNAFAKAYLRPPVKSEDLDGLYFTLVNTNHPSGSSDALKNGLHLASMIIADYQDKEPDSNDDPDEPFIDLTE